jgi:hypothetical protein
VRLDQTREPISCTLNPGTTDEVTLMAQVAIVKHDLLDKLISMSVNGLAGLQASFHKQRLKYYIDWGTPNARKAFLKCQFSIDFDEAAPEAVTTLIAYMSMSISLSTYNTVPSSRKGVRIQKVYACEGDATLIDAQRLAHLHTIYPEQFSKDAIPKCHSFLPAHAIQITWSHVATMVRLDLVASVALVGNGFSYISKKASQSLRDARTLRDLEEAVKIIHLINSLWPGSPCAYLFTTVVQPTIRKKMCATSSTMLSKGS